MNEPVQDNKSQVVTAEAPTGAAEFTPTAIPSDLTGHLEDKDAAATQKLNTEISQISINTEGVEALKPELTGDNIKLPEVEEQKIHPSNSSYGTSIRDNLLNQKAEAKLNPQNSNPLSNFLSFMKWRK